jgi:abhydrolase domain-containing protein 6
MDISRFIRFLIRRFLALCLLLAVTPATAACDFTQGHYEVKGGNLVYSRYGQGPAILLLHGLFAEKEQWHGLACALAAAGYSVIAPDLPGYGQSTGFPLPDYRLENQARFLHQLMRQLSLSRYDVAGSSMGGAIAAIYSRSYRQEFRTLAFLGSPLGVIDWGPEV